MKKKEVIGIDEVGRGPLAGPVTVCAFYSNDVSKLKKEFFRDEIKDSKKLSKLLRNNIYLTIRNKRKLNKNFIYAISSRSAAYIDIHGIQKATKACVMSCVKSLERNGVDISKVVVHLDAGLTIPIKCIRQKSFIKGDEKFTEIALASIMAKESRDIYMKSLAKLHLEYKWEENVGYGTKDHREAIKKVGITKYHRSSYLKSFKLFNKTD
jgi:ribonuclease HII